MADYEPTKRVKKISTRLSHIWKQLIPKMRLQNTQLSSWKNIRRSFTDSVLF